MDWKEALIKSIEVWSIVAEKGCTKNDALDELGIKEYPMFSCFLCELSHEDVTMGSGCHERCDFWGGECSSFSHEIWNPDRPCIRIGSPYSKYVEATEDLSIAKMREIWLEVDLARKKIKKAGQGVLDLLYIELGRTILNDSNR